MCTAARSALQQRWLQPQLLLLPLPFPSVTSQIAADPKDSTGVTALLLHRAAHSCRDATEQTEVQRAEEQQRVWVLAEGAQSLCHRDLHQPWHRCGCCGAHLLRGRRGRKSAASNGGNQQHPSIVQQHTERAPLPVASKGKEQEWGQPDNGSLGAANEQSLLPPAVCNEQF